MNTIKVKTQVEFSNGDVAEIEINAPAANVKIADAAFKVAKSSDWVKRSKAFFVVGSNRCGWRIKRFRGFGLFSDDTGALVVRGRLRVKTTDAELFRGCLEQNKPIWNVTPETAARKLQDRPLAALGFKAITVYRDNGKTERWLNQSSAAYSRTVVGDVAGWTRGEGYITKTSAELSARIANARTIASVDLVP